MKFVPTKNKITEVNNVCARMVNCPKEKMMIELHESKGCEQTRCFESTTDEWFETNQRNSNIIPTLVSKNIQTSAGTCINDLSTGKTKCNEIDHGIPKKQDHEEITAEQIFDDRKQYECEDFETSVESSDSSYLAQELNRSLENQNLEPCDRRKSAEENISDQEDDSSCNGAWSSLSSFDDSKQSKPQVQDRNDESGERIMIPILVEKEKSRENMDVNLEIPLKTSKKELSPARAADPLKEPVNFNSNIVTVKYWITECKDDNYEHPLSSKSEEPTPPTKLDNQEITDPGFLSENEATARSSTVPILKSWDRLKANWRKYYRRFSKSKKEYDEANSHDKFLRCPDKPRNKRRYSLDKEQESSEKSGGIFDLQNYFKQQGELVSQYLKNACTPRVARRNAPDDGENSTNEDRKLTSGSISFLSSTESRNDELEPDDANDFHERPSPSGLQFQTVDGRLVPIPKRWKSSSSLLDSDDTHDQFHTEGQYCNVCEVDSDDSHDEFHTEGQYYNVSQVDSDDSHDKFHTEGQYCNVCEVDSDSESLASFTAEDTLHNSSQKNSIDLRSSSEDEYDGSKNEWETDLSLDEGYRRRQQQEGPKRPRSSYTNEKLTMLEAEYCSTPYITRARRVELAEQLKLDPKQIKIWFQNRRMKQKKKLPDQTGAENFDHKLIQRKTVAVNSNVTSDHRIQNTNPTSITDSKKSLLDISGHFSSLPTESRNHQPPIPSIPQYRQPSIPPVSVFPNQPQNLSNRASSTPIPGALVDYSPSSWQQEPTQQPYAASTPKRNGSSSGPSFAQYSYHNVHAGYLERNEYQYSSFPNYPDGVQTNTYQQMNSFQRLPYTDSSKSIPDTCRSYVNYGFEDYEDANILCRYSSVQTDASEVRNDSSNFRTSNGTSPNGGYGPTSGYYGNENGSNHILQPSSFSDTDNTLRSSNNHSNKWDNSSYSSTEGHSNGSSAPTDQHEDEMNHCPKREDEYSKGDCAEAYKNFANFLG